MQRDDPRELPTCRKRVMSWLNTNSIVNEFTLCILSKTNIFSLHIYLFFFLDKPSLAGLELTVQTDHANLEIMET